MTYDYNDYAEVEINYDYDYDYDYDRIYYCFNNEDYNFDYKLGYDNILKYEWLYCIIFWGWISNILIRYWYRFDSWWSF